MVWRCDVRGRLTALCQYRLKSSITHCVFRNLKSTYDARTNDSSLFFLALESGGVSYADDCGHCSEDIKVDNIQRMLMLESTDTLVIVTQDLMLSMYTAVDGRKFAKTIEVYLILPGYLIASLN